MSQFSEGPTPPPFNKVGWGGGGEVPTMFSENEKFVVLFIDGQMNFQKKLVWDKHSSKFIGYVDLGDAQLNYATLSKV